jgi:hypothetical protein
MSELKKNNRAVKNKLKQRQNENALPVQKPCVLNKENYKNLHLELKNTL